MSDERERFLDRRRAENTEWTIRTYENRLTRFVEFCEEQGIESMSELSGWDLDEYQADREAAEICPTTLRGSLVAVKQLLDYCEDLGIVEDDFAEKVSLEPTQFDDLASYTFRADVTTVLPRGPDAVLASNP